MPQGNNPAFTNDGRRIDWTPNNTGQPAAGYDVHFTQLTGNDLPAPVAAAPAPFPAAAPAAAAVPAAPAGDTASVTKAGTARWDQHPTIQVAAGTTVNDAIRQYRETGTQLEKTVHGALDTGVYVDPNYALQAGDVLLIQPVHKSQSN